MDKFKIANANKAWCRGSERVLVCISIIKIQNQFDRVRVSKTRVRVEC